MDLYGLREISQSLVEEIEYQRAYQLESGKRDLPIPPLTITIPDPFTRRGNAIRAGIDALREFCLSLIMELESHRREIADAGWMPGKSWVHPDEQREKGWDSGRNGEDAQTEIGPDGVRRSRIEELY